MGYDDAALPSESVQVKDEVADERRTLIAVE